MLWERHLFLQLHITTLCVKWLSDEADQLMDGVGEFWSDVAPPCVQNCDEFYKTLLLLDEQMVMVNWIGVWTGCGHRFCTSCNARRAEERVQDGGQNRVTCLHAGCPTTLTFAQLQRLLSKKSFELLTKRLTESAIPEHEKVICPFKDCSILLVKPPFLDTDAPSSAVGFVECAYCHRGFCLECAVPWHGDQSCAEYQGRLKNERLSGDEEFDRLVRSRRWRRCERCHMTVELATGCHHMTCR